jgi:hypothetical protein
MDGSTTANGINIIVVKVAAAAKTVIMKILFIFKPIRFENLYEQYMVTLMNPMGRHVFKIPKSFEQGYNGSEVSLNVLAIEVLKIELT